MTFLPVFRRHKKWQAVLGLGGAVGSVSVSQSEGREFNPHTEHDFFTSFQTTYKPMTFLPVFKRHTNLWLFYQFSNDIQTYDFFTSFQTTY